MPAELKPPQDRTGNAKRAMLVALADRDPWIMPEMPAGRWLNLTKDKWQKLWSSPLARYINPAIDAEPLERWVFCVDELERSRRAFRSQRVVEGSTGQPRLAPAWKQIVDLTAMIADVERQIGVGALNRMRLGVAIGDAAESLNSLWDDIGRPEAQAVEVHGTTLAESAS